MNDNFDIGFISGGILGLGMCFIGMIMVVDINKSQIKSDVKLEPKIELVILDNKVDTLYVYKKQ